LLLRGRGGAAPAPSLCALHPHPSAARRRFQPVHVAEPSEECTLDILKGLQERYEAHHKCIYSDEVRRGMFGERGGWGEGAPHPPGRALCWLACWRARRPAPADPVPGLPPHAAPAPRPSRRL
jgi:hypothetical protein